MLKKRFLVVFIILSLCLSLISCGKNEKDKENVTSTQGEQTETGNSIDLTPESTKIVVWPRASQTKEDDITRVGFVRKYPEYEVDNSVGATSGFLLQGQTIDLQRLAAAITTNEQPDLFMGLMAPIEAYYSNLFEPIHDYLTIDPEVNFDTFDSFIFDGLTFNGKTYFMPTAYDVPVLLWNKDLFEEVGLDPEKPPKTWSEFTEYNQKLVTYDASGKIKTIGFNMLDWTKWYLVASGKQITDETGFEFNFDTPEINKLMEFALSIPAAYGGTTKLPGKLSFYDGQVAMDHGSAAGLSLLPLLVGGKFKFGITTLPKPDDVEEDFVPLYSNAVYCIPRQANNPKGGWMYLKYVMTDAWYESIVNVYNMAPNDCIFDYIPHIPTREKVYDEFESVLTEKSWGYIKVRDEIINKVNMPVYTPVIYSGFLAYMRDEFGKMIGNQIGPKELVSNAQSYGESLIKSFKEQKIGEKWTFNDDGTVIPPQPEE